MTNKAIFEHFTALSTEDKLELLYRLWDVIAEEMQKRPTTDAERAFLEQRLLEIGTDPRGSRSWDEVRDDLLAGQ